MKKIFSTLLAMAMLVTLFVPMTAYAAHEDPAVLPTTPGEFIVLEAEDYTEDIKNHFTRDNTPNFTPAFSTTEVFYGKELNYTDDDGLKHYLPSTDITPSGKAIYNSTPNYTLTVPVSVKKDTVFSLECVAATAGGDFNNYFSLNNDAPLYYAKRDVEGYENLNVSLLDQSGYALAKFTFVLHIPAGTHNLKYHITTMFGLDYIKLTAITSHDVVELSSNSETYAEAETYSDSFLKGSSSTVTPSIMKNFSAYASNENIISFSNIVADTIDLSFSVNAEKAGLYNIASVMTCPEGNSGKNYCSPITVSVNGTPVLDNAKANGTDYSHENKFGSSNGNLSMYLYEKSVYLNEGLNTIEFQAAHRSVDDKCQFYFDYISFKPVVLDDVTIEGNTVTGTVAYEEAVSGTLIVAAYANKELVGSYAVDANDQTSAEISLDCTKAPDTVKVFVWEDLSNMVPVVTAKIFQ